jgi:hypothetical protein
MVQLILILLRQPFILLQQTIISVFYALPYALGLLLTTAGASVKLGADALGFAIRQIPQIAEGQSDEWTRRAISEGNFPYLWQRQLRKTFYGITVLTVLGDWFLILFTLAFILGRVF